MEFNSVLAQTHSLLWDSTPFIKLNFVHTMKLLITMFYDANLNNNLQLVLPFHRFANATSNISYNFFARMAKKITSIQVLSKSKCSRVLKNWHWNDFQTHHLLVKYIIFFHNSIVTTFCRLDVSLRFNVFHRNGSFPPSVFKNGTSYYNCQKHGEKNNKHSLICNKKSYIWK